jgi:hypothetical protein
MMRAASRTSNGRWRETIAEGDKVAARFTMRRHQRAHSCGVPPTGRKSEFKAMNFYRLSEGQFVEEHGHPICSACCSRSAPCQLRTIQAAHKRHLNPINIS